jgi:hypothetical protein
MLFFYFFMIGIVPSLTASNHPHTTYIPLLVRADSQTHESDEDLIRDDGHPLLPPATTSYVPLAAPHRLELEGASGSVPTTPSTEELSPFITSFSPARLEIETNIDHLVSLLASLESHLSPTDKTILEKAKQYRDLTALEQLHRTYAPPVSPPSSTSLKSCFLRSRSFTDDSGTDTPTTATGKTRISFSPASFASPSPRPEQKNPETPGALDLLFEEPHG